MPKHCSISYAKILKYVFFVNCCNIRAVFTHILRDFAAFLAAISHAKLPDFFIYLPRFSTRTITIRLKALDKTVPA